jgi:hypothetical protein
MKRFLNTIVLIVVAGAVVALLTMWLRPKPPVASFVYYLMLLVFAVMPFLVSARYSVSGLRNEARK